MKKNVSRRKKVDLAPPSIAAVEPLMTIPPTPEDDHAYELYIEHQKQAWADSQSGSDEFDKSILTYSSAGLGVSLVFLKDIVPFAHALGLILLYASWIAFGIAILVTVLSFQLSVVSQETHLEHLRKYYLERQPHYLNAPNSATSWVRRLKWVSGISFVLAMTGTIVFSIWNVTEAKHMSDKKITSNPPVRTTDGRPPQSMTPLPTVEKGRQNMAITPLSADRPNQSSSSDPSIITGGREPMSMTPLTPNATQQSTPVPVNTSPVKPTSNAPKVQAPANPKSDK